MEAVVSANLYLLLLLFNVYFKFFFKDLNNSSFLNQHDFSINKTQNSSSNVTETDIDLEMSSSINNEETTTSVTPSPPPQLMKQRKRMKFTKYQTSILESEFSKSNYPKLDVLNNMVNILNVPMQRLNVWFQNRRARLRRNEQKQFNCARLPIKSSNEISVKKFDQPLTIGDNLTNYPITSSYTNNGLLSIAEPALQHYNQYYKQPATIYNQQDYYYSQQNNSNSFYYSNSTNYPQADSYLYYNSAPAYIPPSSSYNAYTNQAQFQ